MNFTSGPVYLIWNMKKNSKKEKIGYLLIYFIRDSFASLLCSFFSINYPFYSKYLNEECPKTFFQLILLYPNYKILNVAFL